MTSAQDKCVFTICCSGCNGVDRDARCQVRVRFSEYLFASANPSGVLECVREVIEETPELFNSCRNFDPDRPFHVEINRDHTFIVSQEQNVPKTLDAFSEAETAGVAH